MGRHKEYDLEQLAEELKIWSTHPTSLNLIGFSRPRMFSVTMLADWAKEDRKFSEALNLAKESIALNRFEATLSNELPQIMHARCEGLYDPLYHKYSRDEKVFESSLKSKENESMPTQVYVVANDGLSSGIKLPASPISNSPDKSTQ